MRMSEDPEHLAHVERLLDERQTQGLERTVTDPGALARIARLLRAPAQPATRQAS